MADQYRRNLYFWSLVSQLINCKEEQHSKLALSYALGTLTWIRTDNVHTGSSGKSLRAASALTSSNVVPGTSSDLTTATHANMRLSVASAGHSMRSRFWSSAPPSDPLELAPVHMDDENTDMLIPTSCALMRIGKCSNLHCISDWQYQCRAIASPCWSPCRPTPTATLASLQATEPPARIVAWSYPRKIWCYCHVDMTWAPL